MEPEPNQELQDVLRRVGPASGFNPPWIRTSWPPTPLPERQILAVMTRHPDT